MKNFFKNIWHEVEPLIVELIVYSILIFAVYSVSNLTDQYVPDKLKDIIFNIKSFVVIGALILSALHTLGRMFIRVIKGIIGETKSDKADKDDDDDNNGNSDSEVTPPNRLNPKSTNFDDAKDIQDSEAKEVEKVKKESEKKN